MVDLKPFMKPGNIDKPNARFLYKVDIGLKD